jgi:hypothetical protein
MKIACRGHDGRNSSIYHTVQIVEKGFNQCVIKQVTLLDKECRGKRLACLKETGKMPVPPETGCHLFRSALGSDAASSDRGQNAT